MFDVVAKVDLRKITLVKLCSSGTTLFSWKFTNVGIGDDKIKQAVARLQETAVAKQLPNVVIQLAEISRPSSVDQFQLQLRSRGRLLSIQVAASVLHEDGRTWVDLDSNAVLPEQFREKHVFEELP